MMHKCNGEGEGKAIEFLIHLKADESGTLWKLKLRLDPHNYQAQFQHFVESNGLD